MLMDDMANELYWTFIEESNKILANNACCREADQRAAQAMAELKALLPKDNHKLFFELENRINHRENVHCSEAYKYAFKQGVRSILELLAEK